MISCIIYIIEVSKSTVFEARHGGSMLNEMFGSNLIAHKIVRFNIRLECLVHSHIFEFDPPLDINIKAERFFLIADLLQQVTDKIAKSD